MSRPLGAIPARVWSRGLSPMAGGSDRAARFLSMWCPPQYLGGCSLAAVSDETDVRLGRNYDLSPNLNEGLIMQTAWTGRGLMGMVESLWGLSDEINDAGPSIARAYGGRTETGKGFGITTILRYVLATCDTVDQAFAALDRVPSHMAYNVVTADAAGQTASIELSPGGGAPLPAVVADRTHDRCRRPARLERGRPDRRDAGGA
jgi:predicted choloylglycine hydrolase